MTDVLIATRSAHKLAEILDVLQPLSGLRLLDLDAAGIPATPDEEDIEAFSTFEENALAKARYFAARSTLPVIADDSGLAVDALNGAPGVHSKRFSGQTDLRGAALDAANNRHLLSLLRDVPSDRRTARYVCVAALLLPDGASHLFRGTCEGSILLEPRGGRGFGYDPLFFLPSLGMSLGQVSARQKNQISHRARAFHEATPILESLTSSPSIDPLSPRRPNDAW